MALLNFRRGRARTRLVRFASLIAMCGAAAGAMAHSAAHMRFTRLPNLVTDDPSIVSMLQDRQSFVWLGALNGGLYRYDGGRIVKFLNNPKDANSLPGERVNTRAGREERFVDRAVPGGPGLSGEKRVNGKNWALSGNAVQLRPHGIFIL